MSDARATQLNHGSPGSTYLEHPRVNSARLVGAPPRPKREAALLKLREAEFFLQELKQRDHGNSIEFAYVLNACMTAARAGHFFLREADIARYSAWEQGRTAEDREVLFAVRKARDFAVHHDGAAIGSGMPFSYVPTPGDYKHTFHLEAPDGTVRVLPAVGACSRYLGLLRSQLVVA